MCIDTYLQEAHVCRQMCGLPSEQHELGVVGTMVCVGPHWLVVI
jgi:hypothetical protein